MANFLVYEMLPYSSRNLPVRRAYADCILFRFVRTVSRIFSSVNQKILVDGQLV